MKITDRKFFYLTNPDGSRGRRAKILRHIKILGVPGFALHDEGKEPLHDFQVRSATRNRTGKDKKYLAWLHLQPSIVTGKISLLMTVHHVRRFGDLRDDRRGVPLERELHQLDWRVKGQPCVEEGKALFERFWGIDLEAAIEKLNDLYEEQKHGITDKRSEQYRAGQKSANC